MSGCQAAVEEFRSTELCDVASRRSDSLLSELLRDHAGC